MALPVDCAIYIVVVAVGLPVAVTVVFLLGGLGESCCDFCGGKLTLRDGLMGVGFCACEISV